MTEKGILVEKGGDDYSFLIRPLPVTITGAYRKSGTTFKTFNDLRNWFRQYTCIYPNRDIYLESKKDGVIMQFCHNSRAMFVFRSSDYDTMMDKLEIAINNYQSVKTDTILGDSGYLTDYAYQKGLNWMPEKK